MKIKSVNEEYPDLINSPIFVLNVDSSLPDWELGLHEHNHSQLMATTSGLVTITTDKGIWVVPPKSAIWIPAHTQHSASGIGISSCYVVFIKDDILKLDNCQMIQVNDFLSSLLKRTDKIFIEENENSENSRLMAVLRDEIANASHQWLYLPLPSDKRLKKISSALLQQPSSKTTLDEWAKICFMSERSLTRSFKQETGLSLHNWRRRLHIILALQWLNDGKNVTFIANELGYVNDSSFITMFKKAMKYSPKKFFEEKMQRKNSE
ncbi:helix-turn-helix transcriptional regulator [Acinetobacter chinensis]|uniref:Helix-turn-helix transcriptional regulator n=1 Tax=Acinetobacter chinensis TaxID=2004650 RepID=A0ABU3WB33_9GAMM|nr:helix-turn-helix transcriptional regulator [Acinetobacter chinensis]MDV2467426.1 helix-turn-helix transcriptional regulator [Acinetobacter chinensis]